jgi:hypothetical protein
MSKDLEVFDSGKECAQATTSLSEQCWKPEGTQPYKPSAGTKQDSVLDFASNDIYQDKGFAVPDKGNGMFPAGYDTDKGFAVPDKGNGMFPKGYDIDPGMNPERRKEASAPGIDPARADSLPPILEPKTNGGPPDLTLPKGYDIDPGFAPKGSQKTYDIDPGFAPKSKGAGQPYDIDPGFAPKSKDEKPEAMPKLTISA